MADNKILTACLSYALASFDEVPRYNALRFLQLANMLSSQSQESQQGRLHDSEMNLLKECIVNTTNPNKQLEVQEAIRSIMLKIY